MKTLDTLKSELDEYKKDYAHYQRLIPHAIQAKKKTIEEGRTLVANAIEHRIKFFNEKSTELKKLIEKRESEIEAIELINDCVKTAEQKPYAVNERDFDTFSTPILSVDRQRQLTLAMGTEGINEVHNDNM